MIAFLPDTIGVKITVGIDAELAALWDRQLKLKEHDPKVAELTARLAAATAKLRAKQAERPDPIDTD